MHARSLATVKEPFFPPIQETTCTCKFTALFIQAGLKLSDDHRAGQTVGHLASDFLKGGEKY